MEYYSCYSRLFFSWSLCVSLQLAIMGSAADPKSPSPSLPCMKKLLPCQAYLHSTSPPASCCVPLREMVEEDGHCLCQIFNDPILLRSFNLTQDDALKLPKACGFNPDISACKNAGADPPSSPGSPSPSTPSNNSRSNSTGGSTAKNSADGMSFYSRGCDFVVALILMFVPALF